MTEAANNETDTKPRKKHGLPDDPEEYRMSIGDHLEDLRRRMILGLLGFIVALAVCLYFGNAVVAYFCRPLLVTLQSRGLPPWTFDRQLGGSFMVYLKISMVTAAAFAGPWMLYQLWLFVAAGLYPSERRWVMRCAPLSVGLLISGMLFVYFIVLPFTIQFFIDWTANMPIPSYTQNRIIEPAIPPLELPAYDGDPDIGKLPKDGRIRMWYNIPEGKLQVFINGVLRSMPFAPMSLVVPQYELTEYIDLVILMLLAFGLAFQLPLVVAAILRIGIVDADMLRGARRYVYFALLIAASIITPGDVITATIALLGPLILLYEFGIILGTWGQKPEEEEKPEESGGTA